MRKKKAPAGSARERLLAAANQLFYEEGIHTVGIDRVIEEAGVAKASLYSTFGSKDELVAAYLGARHERRQRRVAEAIARHESPRDQILAVFDLLGQIIAESEFRGCAFVRASAEGPPATAVRAACAKARGWTRALFTELAQATGAPDPEQLAQQLVLLYDGATVSAQMDHDAYAAQSARAVAASLIDAALARPRARAARSA
jgi:AcrR family transcriptional regulator